MNAKAQDKLEVNNILFIGNSLTYTNDLPELVKTKAKYSGYNIQIEVIAYPNYAISDHWKDGKVQKLISSKKFSIVIIQQGPSSQTKGKNTLIDYGKKYSEICNKNNTLLAYFMVWPSLNYYDTFDGVIENYKLAAETNDAILCPVGEVWKNYFNTSKKFDYYGTDNFHPSKKGSNIAAEVILKSILKYLR
ncbi:SGNH/GDSL hydrolase family protein [uncultured Algibacter sp.]|uniref:SGNH/GDSL hydrolase family protein n=1 Tax=uncultured Algibacter sp. TaxID=298659 RepID=UPI00261D8DAA|nr:SGNH/GDSL hydrolase family protein [uncultured Algibacter sp.]